MRNALALILVFMGGFAIMVLEIIGARFLAKDFGGSFYIWVSQIGVIMIALALGYVLGGVLGDRFQRGAILAWLLMPAGLITICIPNIAPPLMEWIVMRHPVDRDIPPLWQKLDPVIGSSLFFLLPCVVLAVIPPYTIRLLSRSLAHVGRISGLIYAFSTLGSIAGVFIAGYILIDHLGLSAIIRAVGGLTVLLGMVSFFIDDPTGTGAPAAPELKE